MRIRRPQGAGRRWGRRGVALGVSTLLAATAAAYLALPGTQHGIPVHPDRVHAQVRTRAAPTDPALLGLLARLRAVAEPPPDAAPVILNYHDISDRDNAGPFTVTPAHFAAQMRLLHDAGWTTITAAQLDRWLHGGTLPRHPVLVTFDDGTAGVWRFADPVLAEYGQHAMSFVITGFVGTHQPYYMNWAEIRALAASGRWDIESHTHLGHVDVSTDAHGSQGAFLTSRVFLARSGRPETAAEYRRRITSDLRASITSVEEQGLPAPAFFAFPYSAASSTDPEVNSLLGDTVGRLFHASMLSGSQVATTSPTDVRHGQLRRMDVMAGTSMETWVAHLEEAVPTSPGASVPLEHAADWTDTTGRPARLGLHAGVAALDPGPSSWVAALYASARSAWWHDYTASAVLGGFRQPGDGTTAGLRVLAATPDQVEVMVSAGGFEVRRGQGGAQRVLAHGDLHPASSHRVELRTRRDGVVVTVDGRRVLDVPVIPVQGRPASGGIALIGQRGSGTSPVPTVTDLVVRRP